STQHVVDSTACTALQVYELYIVRDSRLQPGPEVILHWYPGHTSGLDAAQSIDACAAGADGPEAVA
ncbi:spermidine/putrescine ABC transporter ATP-binding protein, partial [Streptomyces sp. JAC18]